VGFGMSKPNGDRRPTDHGCVMGNPVVLPLAFLYSDVRSSVLAQSDPEECIQLGFRTTERPYIP
jgi:hypothetical protein